MVKILQYNVQSLTKNGNFVEFYLNNYNFDIVALSEIFSECPNKRNKLANYNLIQRFRNDGYGGVAIGFKKCIRFANVVFDSEYDILITKTTSLNKNLVIASVYFPPSLPLGVFLREAGRLCSFLERFQNVVLMGDFNARNAVWGDTITNRKGKELEVIINDSRLKCINNGSCTFKRNDDTDGSVLDLTFVSADLAGAWEASQGYLGGSRHFPVTVSIELTGVKKTKFLSKKKLMQSLSKLELEPDVGLIESAIGNEMSYAMCEVESARSPKFWWTEELKRLFRKQLAATKKARKDPSYSNLELARREVELWKKRVAEAKKESFLNKINEINHTPNTREAWRFINNVRGRMNPQRALWNEENNEKYLEYLKGQVVDALGNARSVAVESDCGTVEPFEFEEFENCLMNKRMRSAGGHDGVTYAMLKALPGISKRAILMALNNAFLSNDISDNWRTIKIVPIPKPNKDYNDIASFRPISLISVFLKCINLMIKDRLMDYVKSCGAVPARSFAYFKNRSTNTCINELLHRIAILKANGFKVILLSLDISNAYNCVDIGLLHDILTDLGFNEWYCSWIYNFLSLRVLKMGRKEVVIRNGIPQGSCLSPVLFNLYTAGLHSLEDRNTLVFQYADDFILLSFNRDYDLALVNLKSKATLFRDKCERLNLSFNPDKCHTMYFAKTSHRKVDLVLEGRSVEHARQIKFLGRHISCSLAVKGHYDSIRPDVGGRINMLKCLSSIRGGLHPKTALNVYRSLVRSKLEYSRTTTAHSPHYINKQIQRMQNGMLRRCLGVSRSTPVHVIYALAHELPPEHRAALLTVKELLRLRRDNFYLYDMVADNPRVKSSYSHVYNEFKDVFDRVGDIICPIASKKISVTLNRLSDRKEATPKEVIKQIYNKEFYEYKNSGFTIFATDASLSENATGCGVFVPTLGYKFYFKIDFKASSTFGELWALYKALEIAVEDGHERCVFFTDSLAACKALGSKNIDDYVASLFHQKLNLSDIQACHVVWVPGHSGIDFNETVDEIAKQATECGAPMEAELSHKEAMNIIKRRLWERWNDCFAETSREKGKFFYRLYKDVTEKPWFLRMNLDSAEVRIINRLHTGHTCDKVYLHKIGAISTPICDTCWKPGTSHHAIFECTKYDVLRGNYTFFKRHKDIEAILSTKEVNTYKALVAFIVEAEINL